MARRPRRWTLCRFAMFADVWVCMERTDSGGWMYVREVHI